MRKRAGKAKSAARPKRRIKRRNPLAPAARRLGHKVEPARKTTYKRHPKHKGDDESDG